MEKEEYFVSCQIGNSSWTIKPGHSNIEPAIDEMLDQVKVHNGNIDSHVEDIAGNVILTHEDI